MTIVSGKGRYKYTYKGIDSLSKIEKSTTKNSIEGMIIKWKIKLNNKGLKYD
jgi:hypothetical protein